MRAKDSWISLSVSSKFYVFALFSLMCFCASRSFIVSFSSSRAAGSPTKLTQNKYPFILLCEPANSWVWPYQFASWLVRGSRSIVWRNASLGGGTRVFSRKINFRLYLTTIECVWAQSKLKRLVWVRRIYSTNWYTIIRRIWSSVQLLWHGFSSSLILYSCIQINKLW